MTAPTVEGAIAIETARGDEYRAEIWRAGYAAGLEAAAQEAADSWGHAPIPLPQDKFQVGYAVGHGAGCRLCAQRIRSLPIPEDTNGR